MERVRRRNILQWVGAAIAAAVTRPFRAAGQTLIRSPGVDAPLGAVVPSPATLPAAPMVLPLLRTEDFEEGRADLQSVDPTALEAMLRDLRARRAYDASCHDGVTGLHSDYLDGWIDQVEVELRGRGHQINA